MARGRRTPSAVQKLQGNYRERERLENEMELPNIDAENINLPSGLVNDLATKEWLKQTRILSELGMLAETDTSLLLSYCNEMGTYFQCMEKVKEEGMVIVRGSSEFISPHLKIGNTALANAIKLSDKFGFNPAARTKIEMPKKKSGDPFDNL